LDGSIPDWNAKIKAEDANRSLALKQSAVLRATGVKIQASIVKSESERLAGFTLASQT